MEVIQKAPELVQPVSLRRPSFPKKLFDDEGKFVDPAREATLLVPERTVASSLATFEIAQATATARTQKERTRIFHSFVEYLFSLFASLQKRLGRNRRSRARMTAMGYQTLEQLRYLSLLCDATSARTPEEVLEAESAFGEAYYEIMQLSSNLEKMAQREEPHHVRRYAGHMGKVLRAAD